MKTEREREIHGEKFSKISIIENSAAKMMIFDLKMGK